jgi:hypothetical protein
MNLREIITDSIKYWEPRRLIYNGALSLTVIADLIKQRDFDLLGGIPGLFVLAIIANVLYTTVYIADVFVQLSDFRDLWRRFRWLLLAAGTAFACILAWGTFHAYGTW